MRDKPAEDAEKHRKVHPSLGHSPPGGNYGYFEIPYKSNTLRLIVAAGFDAFRWDHVSVSLQNRCPNWEEMSMIKDLFWAPEECVLQYHPPKSDHINIHPYCLHLWKPKDLDIPMPPKFFV